LRAGLIDPVDAALDELLVPRHFHRSAPLQHSAIMAAQIASGENKGAKRGFYLDCCDR
jgi:hypothetical protein